MKIKMPRGDIHYVSFTIKDYEGHTSAIDFDEIFFTVKKDYNTKTALIQKKLSDGSITYDSETSKYNFKIVPDDTNDLKYGEYVFDIELIFEDELKQTSVGTFTLTNEVTFAGNESVENGE